ncbi:hypothetical protein [Rickettsiella endosymbiont of Rhagonycha lignosa]|uniref:hypothetical protein n=1 Tax=Rickettsiella endosymbiont of Rhagonycha lignosa TaxID=3077937 RepID=UPI00313EDFB0
MLLSRLDNQKGTRKILVDLLFKKGYCLCIPDPNLIKLHFEQVRSSWIQKFLLSKNALELSIIPMFMLIFIKNKSLTVDQSKRLFELLHLLLSQTEVETIEEIFFNNNFKQMTWVYYMFGELIKFTLDDFVISDKNSKRIMAMAASIELFFDKASILTISKLTLNTENTGFNILHKLLYLIAYESLHSSQIIYLSKICKKIIDTITHFGLETLVFQTQRNGYSFIWSTIGTWLQIVFERENSNQFKIKHYTHLINVIVEKINAEKLSTILFEKETKGYIIILRFIFFNRFKFSLVHRNLIESFHFFKQWCNKIFSRLTFHQIELILETLPSVLNNDLTLSISDKRQLQQQFFDYLFEFCKLQAQDIARLKDLQEQLEDRFFPSNKIIKFFKQLRVRCRFFNHTNFRGSINSADEISLNESSDLLRPEYARLNANYSTMNR